MSSSANLLAFFNDTSILRPAAALCVLVSSIMSAHILWITLNDINNHICANQVLISDVVTTKALDDGVVT